MEEQKKPELQVSFDKEIGSFAIVDYETQKQMFIDYVNGIKVGVVNDEMQRKVYKANKVALNKLKDSIKTQRLATKRLVESQFSYIEKLIGTKVDEYDKALKDYQARISADLGEEVVVGKELSATLTIKGNEALLKQVLEYANTLGLKGEIE